MRVCFPAILCGLPFLKSGWCINCLLFVCVVIPQLQVMTAPQTGTSSLHSLITSHAFLVYFFVFKWGVSQSAFFLTPLLIISVLSTMCQEYFWVSFFAVLEQRMVYVSGSITIIVSTRALMWASNQEKSQGELVPHLVIQIYLPLWTRLNVAVTLICPHLLIVVVL